MNNYFEIDEVDIEMMSETEKEQAEINFEMMSGDENE